MRSTAIDRRAFLAGAGAALALGLPARAAERLAASEMLFLAPCRRADGSFGVLVLSERGEYQPADTGHRISDRPEHSDRSYLEDKG